MWGAIGAVVATLIVIAAAVTIRREYVKWCDEEDYAGGQYGEESW